MGRAGGGTTMMAMASGRTAGPFTGYGQGRAWPILTGERAHYELEAGRDVESRLLRAMERFSSIGGMLPEQVWES